MTTASMASLLARAAASAKPVANAWQPSDVIALVSVGVALVAVFVSAITSVSAGRRARLDRHLGERVLAYAEFLTSQDARFDAYDRARIALGKDLSSVEPNSDAVAFCRADIDAQRVAAWAVQARLQLLAPTVVRAAANAYADAITAANPLRKLPGRGEPYKGLANDRKGELKARFVDVARRDLAK